MVNWAETGLGVFHLTFGSNMHLTNQTEQVSSSTRALSSLPAGSMIFASTSCRLMLTAWLAEDRGVLR